MNQQNVETFSAAWLADNLACWRNTSEGSEFNEDLPCAWAKTPYGRRFLILTADRTYIGRDWVYITVQEWPSLREEIKVVKPDCEVVLSTTIKHGDDW